MRPGAVLVDSHFQFSDGPLGKKILIVLNDASLTSSFIVVKTTSNPIRKTSHYGCHLDDPYPNFFLPQGCCCLERDTWVGLDEYFEFNFAEWLRKSINTGRIQQLGVLPAKEFKDILLCATQSQDITVSQKISLTKALESL